MIDLWFDYSCPYAYIASERIEVIVARHGETLRWRPMLLGAVLRARNGVPDLGPSLSPDKARYLLLDQRRVAAFHGVPFDPPSEHPRRTVLALRATLALGNDPALIHRFYRAYWVEHQAIEDPAVVAALVAEVHPGVVVDLDAWREPLRAATDTALAEGVFGAPTVVVDGELHFGQDRLHFVEAALSRRDPAAQPRGADAR